MLVLALVAPPASAASCADAEERAAPPNLERIELATLCLVNSERTQRGLKPLFRNRLLDRAAAGHSRDMVARGYFDHTSPPPGSVGPGGRMALVGYPESGQLIGGGENIAAGTGGFSTPASIVTGWMESPGHRSNILSRQYLETGMGVAIGYPGQSRSEGGTYTNLFAARDPAPTSGVTGLEGISRVRSSTSRLRTRACTARAGRYRSGARRSGCSPRKAIWRFRSDLPGALVVEVRRRGKHSRRMGIARLPIRAGANRVSFRCRVAQGGLERRLDRGSYVALIRGEDRDGVEFGPLRTLRFLVVAS